METFWIPIYKITGPALNILHTGRHRIFGFAVWLYTRDVLSIQPSTSFHELLVVLLTLTYKELRALRYGRPGPLRKYDCTHAHRTSTLEVCPSKREHRHFRLTMHTLLTLQNISIGIFGQDSSGEVRTVNLRAISHGRYLRTVEDGDFKYHTHSEQLQHGTHTSKSHS